MRRQALDICIVRHCINGPRQVLPSADMQFVRRRGDLSPYVGGAGGNSCPAAERGAGRSQRRATATEEPCSRACVACPSSQPECQEGREYRDGV